MNRNFSDVMRLFLAVAFIVGGVLVHVDTAAHANSSDAGISHGHAGHGENSGSADLSKGDQDSPGHALGSCIDAHCCALAMLIAPHGGLLPSIESGKLVVGPMSDYALSVALSLLKPPRAIT